MSTYDRAEEGFVRIPTRQLVALQNGELTSNEDMLLDRVARLMRQEGVLVLETKLSDLRRKIGWPHTTKALEDNLLRLEVKKQLRARKPARGDRWLWRIELTGAAVKTSTQTTPVPVEVSEDQVEVSPPPNVSAEAKPTTTEQPEGGGSSLSKPLSEEKAVSSSSKRTAGSRIPPRKRVTREELLQERLRAANRVLAERGREPLSRAELAERRSELELLNAAEFVDLIEAVRDDRARRRDGREPFHASVRGPPRPPS